MPVLLLGLTLALWPMVASGLRSVPGGLLDTRLVHFSLEHTYRFLLRDELHRSFWDPPLFYPARNVAAYTDTMLTLGAFYWPFRLLGVAPDTAFQLWLTVVLSLNFAVAYLFLRRIFALGATASAAGGFLFAFGSPRIANVGHPQIVADFLVLAALFALYRALGRAREGGGGGRLAFWIAGFFLAVVLQAWAAIYPLFFLCMFCALALAAAMLFAEGRRTVLLLLRRGGPAIVIAAGVTLVLLWPLVHHYQSTARLVGLRSWQQVHPYLPRIQSWVLMGPGNLLYGWLQDLPATLSEGRFLRTGTHSNGLGPLTSVLVIAGLVLRRRLLTVRILALVVPLVVLLVTLFPGDFTLWRWVHELLPPARALRALGRVGVHLLIPAAVGIGFLFERCVLRRRRALLATLALLVVAEQAHRVISFDKVDARRRVGQLAAAVEPGCAAFFASTVGLGRDLAIHEDAMWAAVETGVPTINGRYGNRPPGWHWRLYHAYRKPRFRERRRLHRPLAQWVDDRCVDPATVCWIEVALPRDEGVVDVRRLEP